MTNVTRGFLTAPYCLILWFLNSWQGSSFAGFGPSASDREAGQYDQEQQGYNQYQVTSLNQDPTNRHPPPVRILSSPRY